MKKVLIITYYWPPAGGPGVQRWLSFAKYLSDFGIEPHVYVPENPTYPIVDKQLEADIPNHITIIKQPIIEPYSWASYFSKNKTKTISSGMIPDAKKQSFKDKILLGIRGNLFVPDARIFWVKPSVRFLNNYIKQHQIETIITTGPPHSLHLIGYQLQQKNKLRWLADFRDPWTNIGYYKALKLGAYARKKHQYLEHQILNAADHIITTSPTTKSEFSQITNKPITVITNGYDVMQPVEKNRDTVFSLAHIGSLLSDRNPTILWQALKELCQENSLFKEQFQLKLIGKVSDTVLQTINSYGLSKNVVHLGYVSHQEALLYQKNAQVLLLIEIDSVETRGIIPGKIFEYMVSERPIIALGPQQSDIEPIIQTTNTGRFFKYNQKETLKVTLQEYFELYLQNNLNVYPVGLQKYRRKNLTAALSQLILND